MAPADDGVKASEKTALVRFFERELMQALTILKMLRKDLSDLKTVTMPASPSVQLLFCADCRRPQVAEGEARSTDRTRAIQAALLKGAVPAIWLKYPVPELTVNAWVRAPSLLPSTGD